MPISRVGNSSYRSAEAPKLLVWKYLWISNQVVVKQANSDLLERLSAQEDIAGIEADVIVKLIESPQLLTGVLQPGQIQWGVEHVGAPTIWNNGLLGQGVVVGNIDSGVRRSHLTLKNNYRSDHSWYDAIYEQPEPYDDNGHGTHTMATLAGQFGVGVAPNASWIACKAFDENGSATASDVIACGQWIMCPTDPEGKNPDCSKRPKVVSNSWGGSDTGSGFFKNIIDVWTAAGIVSVFSAGNAGPECNTTDSPGSSTKTIAVGALDIENVVAPFSSRGPAYNGNLKPDVSAPGVQVVSADFNSDDGIVAFSGTSMAAPHVAGIAALLCSRSPFLMQQDIRKYLVQSARKTKSVGETCGGIPDDIYPNNIVGYGGVSAPGAIYGLLRDLEAQKYHGQR